MDTLSKIPEKSKVLKSLFVVFIILALFLAIKSLSAVKEYSYIGNDHPAANVIAVNGTGEVFAIPDTGIFSFSVIEEGKTVGEAQGKASTKMNAILEAIKKMGIADKDVKTTGYNSYPKYEYQTANQVCTNGYCPPGKQVLTGYEVSQSVSVKVRKTDDAGKALTVVGDLGASNISGLDFIIDDMDSVNAEARDEAIKDAKAKSEVLAKSLGIKLKRIVNFYESGSQPVYYGLSAVKGGAMDSAAAPVPQVPTGENKIVSNVTITYEIQ